MNSGEEDNVNNTAFVCPTRQPQGVGRPAIVVHEDQIQFLCSLHFSWKKIASLLGISESTLHLRRGGFAESKQGNGSDITGKHEIQNEYFSFMVVVVFFPCSFWTLNTSK